MILKNILSRIGQMIIVLFVLSTITFILMKLTPGDPIDKILHLDVANVSSDQIEATKSKTGARPTRNHSVCAMAQANYPIKFWDQLSNR